MSEQTPTPKNRAVLNPKLVTVRVAKQAIRHEGRTYHPKRQGANGPLPAETFQASPEDVERYGPLVEEVDTPAAA